MSGLSPRVIFFASIFTGNILLVYFLGMCSFLSVSKQVKTSMGLGLAVTFVLTITSALNYVAYYYILEPLKEGDNVELIGPMGDFHFHEGDGEMLFLAGGSGMAPMVSLLHEIREKKVDRKVTFFFGANTKEEGR